MRLKDRLPMPHTPWTQESFKESNSYLFSGRMAQPLPYGATWIGPAPIRTIGARFSFTAKLATTFSPIRLIAVLDEINVIANEFIAGVAPLRFE